MAALPLLNSSELKCVVLKSTTCEDLIQTLEAAESTLYVKDLIAGCFVSFLTAAYDTFHLIFSVKYWSLSFKVSLMVRRSKSIDDANRKVTIFLWVLQGVVVL